MGNCRVGSKFFYEKIVKVIGHDLRLAKESHKALCQWKSHRNIKYVNRKRLKLVSIS